MSELIDNRRHRLETLKGMIRELHDGADTEDVKERFAALLAEAGVGEIGALESELMAEGMQESEIRRMCDVHVAVFRQSLEARAHSAVPAGHPVDTFHRENQVILGLVEELRSLLRSVGCGGGVAVSGEVAAHWREILQRLSRIDVHYKRKEYLLFPFLEKAGISAPPKVMWGLHDEIRGQLKAAMELAESAAEMDVEEFGLAWRLTLEPMLDEVAGMVEKEEKVLLPLTREHLAESEWGAVQEQWNEFGEGLVEPAAVWRSEPAAAPARVAAVVSEEAIGLPSGNLTLPQLVGLLNALPCDITFVDADDRVAYFSEGGERVFERNRAIIGRRVHDCHPPASMHIVEQVVSDLRSGRREVAEFWIQMGGRFVHIRYFAVRGGNGEYLGTLEVTQDVTGIRALEGERRLLAEVEGGS